MEKNQKIECSLPYDKYLFISYLTHKHGEILEGRYTKSIYIDFPWWCVREKEYKRLMEEIGSNLKNLKVILERGSSLSGCLGRGLGSGLTPIFKLPYKEGREFKITGIERDGRAYIEYKRKKITLKCKESWKEKVTKIETDKEGKVKVTITTTIENRGIDKKLYIPKLFFITPMGEEEFPSHGSRIHIAGFPYYEGPKNIFKIKIGDRLNFLKEPDNKYDKDAIAVYWRRKKMGYVPRGYNIHQSIFRLMDRLDVEVFGKVVSIDPEAKSRSEFFFEVVVKKKRKLKFNE